MEKDKMIENMVSIMGEWAIKNRMCWDSKHAESLAKYLIGENVLKVPEGSVILMKEELEKHDEKIRNGTSKEILILLGKGFDETKMTEFRNLPWYKLFCRELKHRYGVDYHDYI